MYALCILNRSVIMSWVYAALIRKEVNICRIPAYIAPKTALNSWFVHIDVRKQIRYGNKFLICNWDYISRLITVDYGF
jgi:hypothetical protein